MIPHYFACAVVQSAQRRVIPQVMVAASPSFRLSRGGAVKDAEDPTRVDVKEARLWIETRCQPIGGGVRAGREKRAVRWRRGFWLSDGADARVNARSPSLIYERNCYQMLSIGAIQEKEKPIAAGLREKLARLTLELGVKQYRRLDRIPVMDIVGRGLKIPGELPRVRVQSHYRTDIEIVTRPPLADHHRIGIAGTPINQIKLRVVGAGHPRHASTVEKGVRVFGPRFGARLTRIWLGVPTPLDDSGLCIQRLKETTNVCGVPGDSGDHAIADHKGRHGREIPTLGIGPRDVP